MKTPKKSTRIQAEAPSEKIQRAKAKLEISGILGST